MKIGINHPWEDYGHDFGDAVSFRGGQTQSGDHKWNAQVTLADGTVTSEAERRLAEYKSCGIEIVRWFVLADGWNFGTPELQSDGTWRFEIPNITNHSRDFEDLLKLFRKAGMKIIPCFVDFRFFLRARILLPGLNPPSNQVEHTIPSGTKSVGDAVELFYKSKLHSPYKDSPLAQNSRTVDWTRFIKCGRSDAIAGSSKCDSFISTALTPLLQISKNYSDVVFAWDVCNEPEMALFPSGGKEDKIVKYADLLRFLVKACAAVAAAGMRQTIGFQSARSLSLDDGSASGDQEKLNTLASLANDLKFVFSRPKFLGQFHYYPERGGQKKLPDRPTVRPGHGPDAYCVGEIGTMVSRPWPSVKDDSIAKRLGTVAGARYEYVFLWAGQNDCEAANWNADVVNELRGFRGR